MPVGGPATQAAGLGAASMQSPQSAARYANAQPAAVPASYRPQLPPPPQIPPGSPPLGLDGYCPVTLVERQQWTMGAAAYGVIHRGRTYLFLGPNEVKKFLTNPDLYSPVHSGYDPVLALDNQTLVPGRREYGVYSDNRVYLFADEASRRKFEQNPQRYAAEALQAAAAGAQVTR
jgi:protein disulfide-isomerase